jgi:hypothetical protein
MYLYKGTEQIAVLVTLWTGTWEIQGLNQNLDSGYPD